MGVVFHRLVQTVRLERDAFVWMEFNDRATGDGAILVGITQLLLALGTGIRLGDLLRAPLDIVSLLLFGAVFWLLYSGAVYVIVHYLLSGHGTFPIYLRITAFAYPTLLLLIFARLLFGHDQFGLVLLVGAAWFVFIVARGISYASDLATPWALLAAMGGYVVVVVIQQIAGSLRIF